MSEWAERGERIGRRLGERVGRAVGRSLAERLSAGEDQDTAAVTDAAGDAGTDHVALSDAPDTRAELEALSYRELQSLAKEAGVKANTKKEQMIDDLVDVFDTSGSE